MKKITTTLLFLIAASSSSIAKEFSEIWRCKDSLDFSKDKIIVTARINKNQSTGEINVSGITHQTFYQVEGFNRRWDFGSKNQYGFIIEPNGDGGYYEFPDEGTTKASMHMKCWQ